MLRGGGNCPELLHHAERIVAPPGLAHLTTLDPVDRDPGHDDPFSGSWNAHVFAGVGAAKSPPLRHEVTLPEECVHGDVQIGESRRGRLAEAGRPLLVRIPAGKRLLRQLVVGDVRGQELVQDAGFPVAPELVEDALDDVLVLFGRRPGELLYICAGSVSKRGVARMMT